jgi:hypothetical protein
MTVSIATTQRNAQLDAITTAVGASGLLRIYDATGGVPASANTAISTQVTLATPTLSATFAPAAAAGVLTANAITTQNAVATGTAAFFRILTSGGTCVYQGTVGTSGQDLNLNTLSIVSGGPVAVSSLTLTAGNP